MDSFLPGSLQQQLSKAAWVSRQEQSYVISMPGDYPDLVLNDVVPDPLLHSVFFVQFWVFFNSQGIFLKLVLVTKAIVLLVDLLTQDFEGEPLKLYRICCTLNKERVRLEGELWLKTTKELRTVARYEGLHIPGKLRKKPEIREKIVADLCHTLSCCQGFVCFVSRSITCNISMFGDVKKI